MKLDRNEDHGPDEDRAGVRHAARNSGRPADRAEASRSDFQRAILSVVRPGQGSFAVADLAVLVGRQPGHDSDRAHAGLIGQECRALERAGLLRRPNAKKPVAWCAVGRGAPGSSNPAKGGH